MAASYPKALRTLKWRAKSICPTGAVQSGVSSAFGPAGARGNGSLCFDDGYDGESNCRSTGQLRGPQGTYVVTFIVDREAPPRMQWLPSPEGTGITSKSCVGYRTRWLKCTFTRVFQAGVSVA
jgi:hypothetical protein